MIASVVYYLLACGCAEGESSCNDRTNCGELPFRRGGIFSKASGGIDMRLRTRMTLMQVATVVVAIMALCWLFIQQITSYAEAEMATFREEKMAEEKQQLKDFVQMASGTIESYYARSQDVEALKKAKLDDLKRVVDAVYGQVEEYYARNKDVMGHTELVQGLSSLVLPARYDGSNYVWVHDLDNVMLVHPTEALVGKDPMYSALILSLIHI
eukprot:TRINITY_DN7977_c0_g1_i4.p3 TRINITY_DN7977_c0_g1~~TRINITY_DN7977_c0_g1_i4.p3  ORF type:complete len:212 (-),score=36.57 TRINITY_DN7977_c0_g1_i4:170-805(-)